MLLQNDTPFKRVLLVMERLEIWGYVTAGLSFLALGMIIFARGWFTFFAHLNTGLLHPAMTLMVDLLLVIIFLELFRTLVEFLKTNMLSIEPFLHIGIVAAIRRILTVTAHETLTVASTEQFNRYLLDIGLHGILVIGLVFCLFLHGRKDRVNP